MNRLQGKQIGASVIGLIITLAVIGYVAFVGIQYVPQLVEAQTVDSILVSIRKDYQTDPSVDAAAIKRSLDKHLNINEINDLQDSFEIDQYGGNYTIKVSYDRNLDLLYTKKVITYDKSITLN